MMDVTPLDVAISAHRAAWDAFQVAPGGDDSDESMNACCELADALDALVLAACAFPVLSGSLPAGAPALLAHLRWWLAEEADFADGYQPAYGILQGRAADLAVVLDVIAGVSASAGPSVLPTSDSVQREAAALVPLLERDVSRHEPDPIFPALAAMRAADLNLTAVTKAEANDESDEAEARFQAAGDAWGETLNRLYATLPTTLAGFVALTRHHLGSVGSEVDGTDEAAHIVQALALFDHRDSERCFSGVDYRFSVFPQALGTLIPQQVFGGAR